MEQIRDETGRFKPGHPGQKPVGAKSELRKKVLAFVEERWEELPKWFDSLKEKDKLLFIIELLPYLMPRLKQVDATINGGSQTGGVLISAGAKRFGKK